MKYIYGIFLLISSPKFCCPVVCLHVVLPEILFTYRHL